MTNRTPHVPAPDEIRSALPATTDAQGCLNLAAAAEASGDVELTRSCLDRAVALDRRCQPGLINLAALAMDEGDTFSAFALLEEAGRVGPLPAEVETLRQQLLGAARNDERVEPYLRAIGRTVAPAAPAPLSIVLVTSAFGAIGRAESARSLAALADALSQRGHKVKVVTARAEEDLDGTGEPQVLRTLQLEGRWDGDRAVRSTGPSEEQRHSRDNASRVRTALAKSDASLVVIGSLDLLDPAILTPALERGIPVLHLLDTAQPPFTVDEQPRNSNYAIVPATEWTATALRNAGYETERMDAVHPAVDVERCFRLFLPEIDTLRICSIAPLGRNRGADTLLSALAALNAAGARFTAEIAGQVIDEDYVEALQARIRDLGLEQNVRITTLPADSTASEVLDRNNVFVCVGSVAEAFGFTHVRAMAAGLVVVATAVGGVREIVRDGEDGLVVSVDDADDLRAKLAALADDRELMQRLQRAGQSRATAFSGLRSAEKIEAIAGEVQAAIEAARLTEDAVEPLV